MFKKIDRPDAHFVTIIFEGQKKTVPTGITVTAAVFLLGIKHTHLSPMSGSHRAPYCQMGVCFECLMEIDNVPNQQGCLTYVAEGMEIRRQLDQQKDTHEK
jgi:predicted molibdopterin-dependent oxidoreductase YjgC